MKLVGTFERALFNDKGAVEVTFSTRDRAAVDGIKQLPPTPLNISVAKHTKQRTLSANSYFHLLISEIAEAQGLGIDEVKKQMVLDFGTVVTDSDGEKVIITLPKSVDVNKFYEYAKWIEYVKCKDKIYSRYLFFKAKHTLYRVEMTRLIDGVVQEAKAIGIETRTPTQIAEMLSYDDNRSKCNDSD
ncbi:MAG: hypothetical protein RSA24_00905 [Clostridia bacterium]